MKINKSDHECALHCRLYITQIGPLLSLVNRHQKTVDSDYLKTIFNYYTKRQTDDVTFKLSSTKNIFMFIIIHLPKHRTTHYNTAHILACFYFPQDHFTHNPIAPALPSSSTSSSSNPSRTDAARRAESPAGSAPTAPHDLPSVRRRTVAVVAPPEWPQARPAVAAVRNAPD